MILEMGTPLSAEGAEILRTAREIPGFTNHGRSVTGQPVEIRVGIARGPGMPVVEVNRDDPYFILVEFPKAMQIAVAQTLDEHEKRMRSMVEQIATDLKAAGDVRIKAVEEGVEAAANRAGLRVAEAIRAESAEWKTRGTRRPLAI